MSKQRVGYKIYEMILGLALVSIIVRAGSAINTDSAVQTVANASPRLNIHPVKKSHTTAIYVEPKAHKGPSHPNKRVQAMTMAIDQ